ncbi:MAG: DUF1385 domain-containing protein [Clostridia bacterium]|nr:DUF1385 domain-containing protein [Clostridia bacterium]
MSKKDKQPKNCRLGGVGGQAIIEGVMMKSKTLTAIAVRRMDNKKIAVTRKPNSSVSDKIKIFKLPILRGFVAFIESMVQSFSTINTGTDMLGLDYQEENASKFDKWVEKHCGKWLISVVSAVAMVLGVALAALLFIWLPTFIGGLVLEWFGEPTRTENGIKYIIGNASATGVIRSVVEGVLKVVIFVAYIWLTSLIPDMKRVYKYHGAEHKSIFCYEAGLELTVENVKKQSRFHPRCGTSFMFAMMLLSIFIGIFITIDTVWLRSLIKICLLPFTMGIGYEFIRYAGKHDNLLIRILAKPGLWMQNLTTREPEDDIIEVGITSLKCALPDDFPNFYEECVLAMKEWENKEETTEETTEETAENPEETEAKEETNLEA